MTFAYLELLEKAAASPDGTVIVGKPPPDYVMALSTLDMLELLNSPEGICGLFSGTCRITDRGREYATAYVPSMKYLAQLTFTERLSWRWFCFCYGICPKHRVNTNQGDIRCSWRECLLCTAEKKERHEIYIESRISIPKQ